MFKSVIKAKQTYHFPSLFFQLDEHRRRAISGHSFSLTPRCEHCMRDHSDDITSSTQYGTRYDSHDTIRPTPIDELSLGSSQCFPERYSETDVRM